MSRTIGEEFELVINMLDAYAARLDVELVTNEGLSMEAGQALMYDAMLLAINYGETLKVLQEMMGGTKEQILERSLLDTLNLRFNPNL